MTPQSSPLSDVKPLTLSYIVTLPNSYKVKIICTDTLTLTLEISLSYVLSGPTFHYNLISLAQLILEVNWIAYFFSILCILQGVSLKKPLVLV